MEYDPAKVFEAAIQLSRVPYESGAYWDPLVTERWWEGCATSEERSRRRIEELEYQLQDHPLTADPGAIWTTGGLAIYTRNYRPHYIETLWGEWYCWLNTIRGYRQSVGSIHALARWRSALDIDEERSLWPDGHIQVWAIRFVGDIQLPAYQRTQGMRRPLEEWVRFCLEHDPPIPLNEYTRYVQTRTAMSV